MQSAPLPLRDIHLPDPISWWPPAIGWWLLAGIIVLSCIALNTWLRYQYQIKHSPANQAQQALQAIRIEYQQNSDSQYLIRELSALFRRLCISLFPREKTASLVGEDWLLFLDQCMVLVTENKPFSRGIGHVLIAAPYRQQIDINGQQLLLLCEQWIAAAQQHAKVGSQS